MKERAKKRLFIAVDVSDKARKSVAEYVSQIRLSLPEARVRWTKPGNLHLTLKFFGDVANETIPDVSCVLEESTAKLSSFNLAIHGTGVFPSARKPKVLWLGVDDPNHGLNKAAEIIDDGCIKLGFPRDNRDFSPHLTIGRIHEPRNGREIATEHLKRTFARVAFSVNEIVLYQSQLAVSGSIYSAVSRSSLAM